MKLYFIVSTFKWLSPQKELYHVLTTEEVGQAISVLSRELSTNEIALFSIVLSAEFGQKNLHSTENKSKIAKISSVVVLLLKIW